MKKSLLKKYARLIAGVGGGIKKGQDVIIRASVEVCDFVKILAEECYRLGAKRVSTEWEFQAMERLHLKSCSVSTLSHLEKWEIEKLRFKSETLPVMLYLESDDPDGLCGIDQNKNAKISQARYQIIKPFRDLMENRYQWCIAAVPGEAWAKKVFPNETKSKAIELLWEKILYTCRVDEDTDPCDAWEQHNRDLKNRCDYLNSLWLESLEYRSSNGTNLRVGLLRDALFMGGAEKTLGTNIQFNPNLPSEEVFTSPKKGSADGIVYATKPLSYRGELIENFSLKFEDGRVTEVHAEKGEALLKEMVSMDEGAAFLGECALVPFESPINQSGVLFFNTLFDENAACHLALGAGFTNVLKNYERYTVKECYEKGINESMIHVDFMIGSKDLTITGITREGERIPIFVNGTWAK